MFHSLLHQLQSRFPRRQRAVSGRKPSAARKPAFELLEERALLNGGTLWLGADVGNGNPNWSDERNWSAGLPSSENTAVFSNNPAVFSTTSVVDTPFSIVGITLDSTYNGILKLNSSLVVNFSSQWDLGTIDLGSNGSLTNNGVMTMNGAGNGDGLHGNGTFTNNGTIVQAGTTDLGVGGHDNGQGLSVKLDNTASGVIDLQSDSGFTSGNGYIVNAGIIEKTAGTGTSTVNVSLKNTGTIDAESGTIQFIGVDSSDTGTSFGTVDTNGTFRTAAGAFIDLAQGSQLPFVEKGVFTATGFGTILLDAGELDIGTSGATLNVAQTVTFSWSNAIISVPAAATLTFDGPLAVNATGFPELNGGGTFVENGVISESGSGDLQISPGDSTTTTVDISAGSTLDFLSDSKIFGSQVTSAESVLLNNAGTIEKTGGTGTSTVGIAMLNNTGIIAVSTGTLEVDGNAGSHTFTNSGNLVIEPGSVLQVGNQVDGSDFAQTAAGSFHPILAGPAQFGQLQVTGQATLAGGLNVSTTNNFAPTSSESFPVVSAGSVSGRFSALSGLRFSNGVVLNPVYSSTGVVLAALSYPLLSPPAQLGQVANGITHTTEHYQDFVTNAYLTYLGRPPDPGGFSGWVGAMQGGLTDEHLEAQFIAGPEFFAHHGGTATGWVRGMYQDLLGRTPSDTEVNGWVQALNNGLSAQSIAYDFAASTEREGIRVRDDYQTFLGRTPNQSEVAGWVNAFANGLTNESLVAGFLASPEYYNSAAKGKGDNFDWVKSVIHDEFEQRAATPGEISSLEAALMPANLSQVANQITHSTEHYQDLVTHAYQTYLGRSPDPSGLSGWVGAMQDGLTDEHLEAQFIASPEAFAHHGGTSAGWVRGLYQDLLGRTPSDAEVNGWVQALNNGASSQTIAYDFAASAEREGIRVRDDYFHYLGRTPSQTEVNGWVNAFADGLTNENLVAGFLASPEYYDSFSKGKSGKADWVTSAFLDVLQRAPTNNEFASWGGTLQ
jgi:hypothetical protein